MIDGHASDCAVHNAPAYDPRNCDCGLEKDIVHGVLKCLKCNARLEFYEADIDELQDYLDAVRVMMLDHVNNNCRVPEGAHQLKKDNTHD